jgi:hypothetical protein
MTTTDSFYRDIPLSHCMSDVFDAQWSRAVPADWLLLMTDVVQSTQAIEAGLYRDVNVAGGLAVMAMANLMESMDFPFVFGGDGVTMLIPSRLENAARAVLLDTRDKVQTIFNLHLRVAVIPMQTLQDSGHQLRVAKLRFSAQYTQAMLDGDALAVAEAWLKVSNSPFLIESAQSSTANFSGFVCRWQDIPSAKGEIVALIVAFCSQDTQQRQQELNALLDFINVHYGQESDYHPVQVKQMRAGGFKLLWREIRIRSATRPWRVRLKIAITLSLQVALIKLTRLLRIPLRIAWMDMLHLEEHNAICADFRKFDGSLKMVISGTAANRNQLTDYLKQARQAGRLYYGLHVSNRAHLTCLVQLGSSSEVHFVDGADGGYAMAAKQLKAQLAQNVPIKTHPHRNH